MWPEKGNIFWRLRRKSFVQIDFNKIGRIARYNNGYKLQFWVGSHKGQWQQRQTCVTFDEAATVFRDSKALYIFDPDHSETEDRWITAVISEKGRLLVVVHTFQEESKDAITIRIISSRKATKQEIKTYGEWTWEKSMIFQKAKEASSIIRIWSWTFPFISMRKFLLL